MKNEYFLQVFPLIPEKKVYQNLEKRKLILLTERLNFIEEELKCNIFVVFFCLSLIKILTIELLFISRMQNSH